MAALKDGETNIRENVKGRKRERRNESKQKVIKERRQFFLNMRRTSHKLRSKSYSHGDKRKNHASKKTTTDTTIAATPEATTVAVPKVHENHSRRGPRTQAGAEYQRCHSPTSRHCQQQTYPSNLSVNWKSSTCPVEADTDLKRLCLAVKSNSTDSNLHSQV